MTLEHPAYPETWPLWRKFIFRFFFILLLLLMSPWTWLYNIPGLGFITEYYRLILDWAVEAANSHIFHVRKVLVPLNGSGDTSYGWSELWLYLSLAFIGSLAWSVADYKRKNYQHLNYWLCLFVRYYVAMIALSYGILKLFALQMSFPNLSQLATPLGDYLPMRFSWLFIGYSTPYQVFSGLVEVMTGLLLVYRRTSTLGAMMGSAVFFNVMMLNLSYDIPVKIFSMELFVLCLFLLANESSRIICFLILNKPAASCNLYHFRYTKKWMRVSRIILKSLFLFIAIGMVFYSTIGYYREVNKPPVKTTFSTGYYDVVVYAINKDTLPASNSDTLRWQDLVFEKGPYGSVKSLDTFFQQRYKRGYFSYNTDTLKHTVSFKKSSKVGDSLLMRYELPDTSTIRLWGKQRNDSLYVVLRKINRHFQLADKQFHWLSEYNR